MTVLVLEVCGRLVVAGGDEYTPRTLDGCMLKFCELLTECRSWRQQLELE